MNDEEKKAVEFIRDLIVWDVRQDLCPNKEECKNLEIILNLIEKQQTKIKELEDDLYSANCIIDDYIDERNKLKNKMIGDKMEQFDDYIIYLIESYLEILEE